MMSNQDKLNLIKECFDKYGIDDPSLSEDYFVVNVSLNKINDNQYEGIKSIDSIDDYTINNSIDKMVKNNDVSEIQDKEMK